MLSQKIEFVVAISYHGIISEMLVRGPKESQEWKQRHDQSDQLYRTSNKYPPVFIERRTPKYSQKKVGAKRLNWVQETSTIYLMRYVSSFVQNLRPKRWMRSITVGVNFASEMYARAKKKTSLRQYHKHPRLFPFRVRVDQKTSLGNGALQFMIQKFKVVDNVECVEKYSAQGWSCYGPWSGAEKCEEEWEKNEQYETVKLPAYKRCQSRVKILNMLFDDSDTCLEQPE